MLNQQTMKTNRIILAAAIAITLFGCSANSDRNRMESKAAADASANAFISSSAAVEKNKDTTRKFIRTADLKFKVKSVIKSTYNIEDITAKQGGFVIYTKLASNLDYTNTIPVSADSSLETTYYTVNNTITLRVPNTKLDSTLKLISMNIDYLDYRVIKAEDVALQILSNNLTQRRAAKNEERLTNAIDSKGKKLKETTSAEEMVVSKQEQADNAKIANLSLTDQIKFSTINLIIYQRQTVKRELIPNNKNIDAYEPGFGSKIVESIKFGWTILETIFIFLTRLWGVFLIGIVAYLVYRFIKNKQQKK